MKAKRRRHDAAFKARVALEALKGIKTIQQIAKDFDVHPVQVSEWKKTLQERLATVFDNPRNNPSGEDFEQERQALRSKIGELTVQVDFLQKKSRQLGLGGDLPGWLKNSTQP
jgi:transposase-like protein